MNKAQIFSKSSAAPPRQTGRILRGTARTALLLWAIVTIAGAAWALSRNPLAAPFVERAPEAVKASFVGAIAEIATPEWISARLEAAIAAHDADDVELYLDLAKSHAIPLPDDLTERAEAIIAAQDGLVASATACGKCALDASACPNLKFVAACLLPFQLSPAGDVTTLGHEGTNWITGKPVDQVDAALAAVGLAATVVAIPSLGASVPVKLGASALRIAKRADALTPGLMRAIKAAARESGGGARLQGMASDVTRIASATSPAEALSIIRVADDAADLKRLAKVSEIAGKDTRLTLRVLGKAHTLRLLHRLSDTVVAAFGFVMALIAQLGALLGGALKLGLRRLAR